MKYVIMFAIVSTIGSAYAMQQEDFSPEKLDQAINEGQVERVRSLLKNLTTAGPAEMQTMAGPEGLPMRVRLATRLVFDRKLQEAQALIEAIRLGNAAIVRMLIKEFKTDVNPTKGAYGYKLSMSPLQFARRQQAQGVDEQEIINLLEQEGAR